jgi:hypothetical protein
VPAAKNILAVFLLPRGKGSIAIELQQLREADDGVQGGAQLVIHLRQEVGFGPAGCLGIGLSLRQHRLPPFVLADVHDGAQDHGAVGCDDGAQADFDWEFAAIFAAGVRSSAAHGPQPGRGEEACAVGG